MNRSKKSNKDEFSLRIFYVDQQILFYLGGIKNAQNREYFLKTVQVGFDRYEDFLSFES